MVILSQPTSQSGNKWDHECGNTLWTVKNYIFQLSCQVLLFCQLLVQSVSSIRNGKSGHESGTEVLSSETGGHQLEVDCKPKSHLLFGVISHFLGQQLLGWCALCDNWEFCCKDYCSSSQKLDALLGQENLYREIPLANGIFWRGTGQQPPSSTSPRWLCIY